MKDPAPYTPPASDLTSGDTFGQKDEARPRPRRFLGLRHSEWFMLALFVATVVILLIAFLAPAATAANVSTRKSSPAATLPPAPLPRAEFLRSNPWCPSVSLSSPASFSMAAGADLNC